jgi:hypothetical protein
MCGGTFRERNYTDIGTNKFGVLFASTIWATKRFVTGGYEDYYL